MKKYWKSFGLYAVIFMFVLVILAFINNGYTAPQVQTYTYSDLIEKIEKGDVSKLQIEKSTEASDYGTVTAQLKDGTEIKTNVASLSTFSDYVNKKILENGLNTTVEDIPRTNMLSSILPSVVLMILAVALFSFMFQRMQGGGGKVMSFGKSKAKVNIDDKNRVTFDDVAGLDEEKAELSELVEFLKEPKKYVDLGARIPKGVLLVGPPGTGKTLLAKAVAGEAKVPFFSISGSDFVEMFVGVGASRVRDLFDQAKKNSPCIVFIDEIDAVGRRRGAGLGGGHDEREQTLNQLLVEMDGFGINEGVIVIAATNRADILDPAILRPGRFDRQVYVGRPDVKGREAILKVHSKGKPFADDVDLNVVAKTTSGFTGADLENLLNEAALLSARHGKKKIDMAEIQQAFIKVGIGTEKKSRIISEKEKRITAYHESGHAILFEVLSELDPVHSISIIPTGMAGGYTMPLPGEDKMYITKKSMEQEIISFLGGRAAEYIIFKDVTTGASNDIKRATAMARSMVMKYGMSDKLGPIQFGDDQDEVFLGKEIAHSRNYGEDVAALIDQEVRDMMESAYEEAKRILNDNIKVLHASAKLLCEKEKITGAEFRALFKDPDSVLDENLDNNDNKVIRLEKKTNIDNQDKPGNNGDGEQ
ncbi:MAG: ATP-dependent zinc metalloprotease FtsH [Clostridia bacterium]|nr:ATP-dependent zinc metalloprotease FtsH [Clostridia bacterium]MCI1999050.1 ATP-dependent zinc metalloprotease FtsH [Clostridia bacterium]MCI2013800.1 ATP-dependent zinc metalloprotease FtsH [Clostridia bacterium]